MDLKTKLLLSQMKDNDYFRNLNSYLTEMVKEEKLTYDNLKYLYNKLYKNKSLFIKQNIFPVGQFLIKGYSIQEAEKVAELLPDANGLTIFCYDKKEKGDVYNKLFRDLEFVYMKYDYYKNIYGNETKAYELLKKELEKTTIKQREKEVQKQGMEEEEEM